MKLEIKLEAGTRQRDFQLELPAEVAQADRGTLEIELEGERRRIDWALITPGVYSLLIGGRSYEVQVARSPAAAESNGSRCVVNVGTRHYEVEVRDPRRRRHGAPAVAHDGPQEILAPMPGRIVKILVKENQQVPQGAGLLVIEAMKMQNELRAPRPGRVEKIYVEESAGVETGCRLIRFG